MESQVIFSNEVGRALDALVEQIAPSSVHVLVDSNTRTAALPVLLEQSRTARQAHTISILPGDDHKDLKALESIWAALCSQGATRKSLLVCLGGGMVTDIGGFAASAFKRGIKCINVPTTLLGAVDAAVGGKTAINFQGLKNEIGAFSLPYAVILSTVFFGTLPIEQLVSGYAEMLKHGLLDGPSSLSALLLYDISGAKGDLDTLLPLMQSNVCVKQRVVEADPLEQGLRKTLNLGHTAGHAFESFAMVDRQAPIPHGYAVAWGLIVELVLSVMKQGFPSETMHRLAAYIKENYGGYPITCNDYDRLIELMRHDKKNADPNSINFTMLQAVGSPLIDQTASEAEIKAALDIFRDIVD